jgi:transposase-like protein
MYQSIDFFQFQKRFATEARCRKFLIKQRWQNGFECPKCGHNEAYFIETRLTHQCKKCRHQISLTAGTIFHKTRTALRKWFWMIYLLSQSKHSYSILGLQKMLNIKTYRNAWLMAHKIRKALKDRDALYKLNGILEMDDSYFGAQHATGKRGRGAEKKSKVIVSVKVSSDNEKPIFASMSVVSKIDKVNISQVAQNKIESGSKVITDGWPAYNTLEKTDIEHIKKVVGDPKNASVVLPWVHTVIANCKGILKGVHHGVSKKHLHYYLAEFCYRFNRRFWQGQLFDRMINACLNSNTISLAELKA